MPKRPAEQIAENITAAMEIYRGIPKPESGHAYSMMASPDGIVAVITDNPTYISKLQAIFTVIDSDAHQDMNDVQKMLLSSIIDRLVFLQMCSEFYAKTRTPHLPITPTEMDILVGAKFQIQGDGLTEYSRKRKAYVSLDEGSLFEVKMKKKGLAHDYLVLVETA